MGKVIIQLLCSVREEGKFGQARRPEHMGCTTIVGSSHSKQLLSSHSMDNASELRPELYFLLAYKEDRYH